MREIKFRAWDSTVSKMYYVGDVDQNGHGFLLNLNGDLIDDRDNGNFEHTLIWARIGHQMKLMQYTGLKDKNGREIFEGDIVLADDNGEYFPQEYNEEKDEYYPVGKYEVYWDHCGWWLKNRKEEVDYEAGVWGDASLEIIGNIYENPEILEKSVEGEI